MKVEKKIRYTLDGWEAAQSQLPWAADMVNPALMTTALPMFGLMAQFWSTRHLHQ